MVLADWHSVIFVLGSALPGHTGFSQKK